MRYPNGTILTYTYDACQRLKEECLTDASGKQLAKYNYTLGKAGERTKITETKEDGTVIEISYKYDKLNRLVKEEIQCEGNKLTNEFTYDAVSNRTSRETTIEGDVSKIADVAVNDGTTVNGTTSDGNASITSQNAQISTADASASTGNNYDVELTEGKTTYTYNDLNQLITETSEEGNINYEYDDNGNLIKQTGLKNVTYLYDKENHLLQATVQKGNAVTIESYTYDYAGNRISKQVNEGAKSYYVIDESSGLAQVVAETDEAGNVVSAYTLNADEHISMERDGNTSYYLYDGHGSVRGLVDEEGKITDSYSYDACGNLLQAQGETKNDFLYTGEQYNATTGLYYLRARYMNPSTGTFISMDSYQGNTYDPISLHKYLYANANPVMNTDPTGYFSISDCSIATSIQSTLSSVNNFLRLHGVIKWADAICTVYDTAMEIRNVIFGGGDVGDVILALLKGVVVGFMVDGMCKTPLGIILKPMMAIFGLGSQVDLIEEAFKSGDPLEIAIRFVQLVCMLFGITSQCFTGETLVSTENGLVQIADINVGDYVWTENVDTGEKELKRVLQVYVNKTDTLVHVSITDGNGSETTVNTTENHPFYVDGKGWVAASQLKVGDKLHTKDGKIEIVKEVSIEKLNEPVKVYNLEVDEQHTYYVCDNEVLVHNECTWNKGSFDTAEESIQYHYDKHKDEVGATSIEQYLRKAEGFMQNLKGAKKKNVEGVVQGVIRYIKNGKYIDIAPDKSIVSFGGIDW